MVSFLQAYRSCVPSRLEKTSVAWLKRDPSSLQRSPFSGASVLLAMSFAKGLLTRAGAANRNYAEYVVQKFQAQCVVAADEGKTSFTLKENCSGRNVDMVMDLVEAQLDQMGFDSCNVDYDAYSNLFITASWQRAAPEKEPAADRAGSTGTCPVCHEDRPVVALMPCGHVVCKQCQGQLRQCPMCRIQLTGATRALFLS